MLVFLCILGACIAISVIYTCIKLVRISAEDARLDARIKKRMEYRKEQTLIVIQNYIKQLEDAKYDKPQQQQILANIRITCEVIKSYY